MCIRDRGFVVQRSLVTSLQCLLLLDLLFDLARRLFQYEVDQRPHQDSRRYREVGATKPALWATVGCGGSGAIERSEVVRDRRHPVKREVDWRGCLGERNRRTDQADRKGDDAVPLEPTGTTEINAVSVGALQF